MLNTPLSQHFALSILCCTLVLVVAACSEPLGDLPQESAHSQPTHTSPATTPNTNTTPSEEPLACDDTAGLEVFNRHIAPLLDEERPSSCNGCHLTGTELSLFVRGSTPCEAMGCLLEKDLVDFEDPENSTILQWIERGNSADNPMPEEVVEAEYQGFLEWIEFSAACHNTVCEDTEAMCFGEEPTQDAGLPDSSNEDTGAPQGDTDQSDDTAPDALDPSDVPEDTADEDTPEPTDTLGEDAEDRDTVDDTNIEPDVVEVDFCEGNEPAQRLLDTFMVPWRGRCEHCHATDSVIRVGDPPMWLDERDTLEGALWTIQRFHELDAINYDDPSQSRILLKPLAEDLGGIEHGGGRKFLGLDDASYLALRAWLESYTQCTPLFPSE